MEKINYKKVLKHLYNASSVKISVVDVPEMNFLAIDGVGDPNTSESYAQAVEALYSVAYTLKFMLKKGPRAIDYGVMPLEGLWWTDDMSQFSQEDKSNWKWTAMIMQPELISREEVQEATVMAKSRKELLALPLMEFRTFKEGKCAQIMHIGPFSEEGPTIQKVHQFILEQGKFLSGTHHEVYLSDIRRAAPEKWKTIIRQPFN